MKRGYSSSINEVDGGAREFYAAASRAGEVEEED